MNGSSSRGCHYAYRLWRDDRHAHDGFLRFGESFSVVYLSVRRLVLGIGQLRVPGGNVALWNRGKRVGGGRVAQVL